MTWKRELFEASFQDFYNLDVENEATQSRAVLGSPSTGHRWEQQWVILKALASAVWMVVKLFDGFQYLMRNLIAKPREVVHVDTKLYSHFNELVLERKRYIDEMRHRYHLLVCLYTSFQEQSFEIDCIRSNFVYIFALDALKLGCRAAWVVLSFIATHLNGECLQIYLKGMCELNCDYREGIKNLPSNLCMYVSIYQNFFSRHVALDEDRSACPLK